MVAHGKIPGIARTVLHFLLPDQDYPYLSGDFDELYDRVLRENGRAAAHLWIWAQIARSLPGFITSSIRWSLIMLGSYFKTALRNIRTHKLYSFINISGLSIGIAAVILIFLYVRKEYSYDDFHENSGSTYRVIREVTRPGRPFMVSASTSYPMGTYLAENYPEITALTRLLEEEVNVRKDGDFFPERIHYVDPGFFDIFSFDILQGSREQPFSDINSIVITQKIAEKYFGNENPIGKALHLVTDDVPDLDLTVSAVMGNVPENSSIRVDILLHTEKVKDTWGEDWFKSYGYNSPETYIQLAAGASAKELEEKMKGAAKEMTAEAYEGEHLVLKLQPLAGLHLDTRVWPRIAKVSNPVYAYVLSGLGVLILFIACANFTILSVGQSGGRAREIGIRKVLGAYASQLKRQYLSEAVVTSLLALIIGIIAAKSFLPVFSGLSGESLAFDIDAVNAAALAVLVLGTGIAAGSYPSLILSRFQPAEALKGSVKSVKRRSFGRGLIVIQFSISIFLIVSAIIMREQLLHLTDRNLGFNKEHVALVTFSSLQKESSGIYNTYRNELLKHGEIINVSAQSEHFGQDWTWIGFKDENGKVYSFYANVVDSDYIETMKIKLLRGRNFSRDFGAEAGNAFIVNEAFVRYFGLDDPLNNPAFPANKMQEARIVGVVENFNFNSLHDKIEPLALALSHDALMHDITIGNGTLPFYYRSVIVRVRENTGRAAIDLPRDTWKKTSPGSPFEISFLDSDLRAQYEQEQNWSRIIGYASALAVVIACLGLFGLSTAAAEKRLREIGIRKVLGASTYSILGIITSEMLLLVVLANVIAWPAAYYTMNRWLSDFAYRIDIGWQSFALAAALALLIALCMVSYQVVKAALTNPVDVLKHE